MKPEPILEKSIGGEFVSGEFGDPGFDKDQALAEY
jgi:hypothetical protein